MQTGRRALYLLTLLLAAKAGVALSAPLIAQAPALSRTHVAFTMGGEIWLAERDGKFAHRLTAGAAAPRTGGNAFSPDGTLLAYTATYGADPDVYVIAVAGGQPRRLTFDGGRDEVIGWSADGKSVLFRSTRDSYYPLYGLPRVYAVSRDGGPAKVLPFPVAYSAAPSPDGSTVAVEPQQVVNLSWKQYRGGDQRRILLVDPNTLEQRPLPGPGGNDYDPMWIDGRLYFLSDCGGRTTLQMYEPASGVVRRLFDPAYWDLKNASAGPDGKIVFSQLNGLSLFDPGTRTVRRLDIRPLGELPGTAPVTVDLSKQILDAAVSNDGEVAFEARGRTVVVDNKGGVVVLGAADHMQRAPSFMAPGKVGFVSDESGVNQLAFCDLTTRARGVAVAFDSSAYYRAPLWSPDGLRVAYMDLKDNIWVAKTGAKPRRIDRESTAVPRMAWAGWDGVWSWTGRELAYSRTLPSGLAAVFVWSESSGTTRQVTPSDVDARHPAWDADGKRLWFTASRTAAPAHAYLDQSERMRPPALRRVFWTSREDKDWARPRGVDLPARRYEGLFTVRNSPGQLLILETIVPPGSTNFSQAPTQSLLAVDADAPAVAPQVVVDGIGGFYPGDLYERFTTTFRISSDRSRIVFRKGTDWTVAALTSGGIADQRQLSLADATVVVEPRVEWRQMFDDSLRQVAYFLHDPTHAAPDVVAWRKRYGELLDSLGSRQDLTTVLEDILGELHLSHADATEPAADGSPARPQTGTLGVDTNIQEGRYRISRIFHSTMFGEESRAPLDDPQLAAQEGDWIVSIDGRAVAADRDLAEYLQGTAGRPIRLCLASDRNASQGRCANVRPMASDASLRFGAWLEERQAIVDRLSGGRVGYLHASDTMESGITEFNQARYAQHDREGFVVDVRFNGGGYAADYFVDALTAPLLSRWLLPEGRVSSTPGARLRGPKAMVINAYCGSGCDTYAYYFKLLGIGPLVGAPTWGGVSGSGGTPLLMDGGWVNVPQYTMVDGAGAYALEGQAVRPTIEVEYTLQDMAAGKDPQLERAVKEVLQRLGSPSTAGQ